MYQNKHLGSAWHLLGDRREEGKLRTQKDKTDPTEHHGGLEGLLFTEFFKKNYSLCNFLQSFQKS